MGLLSGVTIVEWGNYVSAPYCGRLLVQLGARVYKIEPPSGDESRAYGPFSGDRPDPENSGLYLYLNGGKIGVTLDVTKPTGRDLLLQLLSRADAFVSNYPLRLRRRLGLDYRALSDRFPELIVVSVTIFGDSGPRSEDVAYSIDADAVSGACWAIGEPEREPLILPCSQAEFQAGAHAAAATVAALLARNRGCGGQHVDVAASDVLATYVGINSLIYVFHGLRWSRSGRRAFGSGGPYPYVILPCKDGLVALICRARHEWERLVQAMGQPQWADDPRYQDLIAMGRDYPEEVDALIMPWLAQYTRAELLHLAAQYNFPIGPVHRITEVVAHPHLHERGFFVEQPHPSLGSITVPGAPYRFSATPINHLAPAPRLGEHNELVFCGELGLSREELTQLRRTGVV
jgi:crotonobetainyl-CoA:carnitine CoA-transferase CaiB-like acyl-CoA transferase